MEVIVSEEDLVRLTGYRQPAKQLRELLARGFWRAAINGAGRVVLEMPHYLAVCGYGPSDKPKPERQPELLPADAPVKHHLKTEPVRIARASTTPNTPKPRRGA